jgi:hypothetical protein
MPYFNFGEVGRIQLCARLLRFATIPPSKDSSGEGEIGSSAGKMP